MRAPTKGIAVEVDVIVEDRRWNMLDLETLANRACRAALAAADWEPGKYGIELLACDDRRIAGLNGNFRDRAAPTNVLAWPIGPSIPFPGMSKDSDAETSEELGCIAVSWETCRRESHHEDAVFANHVQHLIVHGCLHLLGFRHEKDTDSRKMEESEIAALASIGVPNPYWVVGDD